MIAANVSGSPLVTPANLSEQHVQALLRGLSLVDREAIALATGTMVQYYGDEVAAVRLAEETAALRAKPQGLRLEDLNGLNVGCGERSIHAALLGVDVHQGPRAMGSGSAESYVSHAHLRGWADDLPFRSGSVDFLVALHVLEHEPDPAATVLHWLDIVKPGGGVGIVVPDWRYTWDARNDRHPWSHRWNPTPRLLRTLHERHWAGVADLEHLDTYPYRLSFDVVLRKKCTFVPFDEHTRAHRPTGYQLDESNRFLGEENA